MRHVQPRPLSLTSDAHMDSEHQAQSYKHKSANTCSNKGTTQAHSEQISEGERGIPEVFSAAEIYLHSHLYEAWHLNKVACALNYKTHWSFLQIMQVLQLVFYEPQKRMLLFKANFSQPNQSFPLTGDWELWLWEKWLRGGRKRWPLWELIICQRLNANTVNWVTNTYENDW